LPLRAFEGILNELIEAPEHARRMKMVLDALPVGIVLAAAPDGRIVFGNRTIESMLGHSVIYSKDVGSYGEWSAFDERGRRVDVKDYPLARVMQGEPEASLECRYLRGDGKFIWIKVTGAPLYDKDGILSGAVVCVTDI
jgi:PAS domain S-box-containing protein